jgi:hypothetical protein
MEAVVHGEFTSGDIVAEFGNWLSTHEPDAIVMTTPPDYEPLRARLNATIREPSRRVVVLPFLTEGGDW